MNPGSDQIWQKQSYYDIYKNHQGYACHKWTHYPFIYDQIFARYLDAGKPLRLLEIGIQNGGSLEIWKKYLPPGSEIHGLNINPKCLELEFDADIHFHLGSAADNAFVNHLFAGKRFDVILDDGSHHCDEVISTFLNLFKKINPGGVYIIEDLHTSYWKHFGGGFGEKQSSIEFFKQFVDIVHASYFTEDQLSGTADFLSFLKLYQAEISGISFFDSICAITRFAKSKQRSFAPIVNGTIFKVEPPDAFTNYMLKDKLQDIETAHRMYATTAGKPDASSAMDAVTKANDLLACGIEAFQQSDLGRATESLSEAMAAMPENPLPLAYLAFVCAKGGFVAEAREFIAEITRLAPERADLVAALGEVFLQSGKPAEAAEYLQAAILAQPDLFAAYPAYAESLRLTGRIEEAISLLQPVANIPSNAQSSIQSTLSDLRDLCEPSLRSTMKDGLLRIRITNTCNAKCRYCGIRAWPEEVQKMSLRNEILYEYGKPLYEKIKILLLTGGDPLITKESLPFCRFISENYPQVTLYLETNGIAFRKEWQRIALKNLMIVHVSVNASNEETFRKGCWEAGGKAYQKLTQNIRDYMALLRENGLEVFAPDVSMVVNRDTAKDIRDFVKYALTERLRYCTYYFDYTENNMAGNYFGCPDIARPALRELMKLERVLAGKFFIYFRLWIPLKEAEMMQPQVDAIPIDKLREEYSDILALAKDRSMKSEYETRQALRRSRGKKEFSFEEDWTPTLHQTNTQGKEVCFAPFHSLDIYPDEKFECCGWITPRFDLRSAINNGSVDWDGEYNRLEMVKLRKDILAGRYDICQRCCPLNPNYNELSPPHKYGYERETP